MVSILLACFDCLQNSAGVGGQVGSEVHTLMAVIYLVPTANRQEETNDSSSEAY